VHDGFAHNRVGILASKCVYPLRINARSVTSFMETRVSGQREDRVTGAIESQTSKVPSSAFLGIAIGCMATSLVLQILGKEDWALFVGQWPAPLLIMGSYNKMVKQHGSDAHSSIAA
jgi:hypothetical protein